MAHIEDKEKAGYRFGMDKEIAAKLGAKRDPKREQAVQQWIEKVTGQRFGAGSLHDNLKDGTRLCALINKIHPGSVKNVKQSKMPFVLRENIVGFLDAARRLGVPDHDLFVTQDLFEGENMVQVVTCLYALGGVAQKRGYRGPTIGAKHAEKNERGFDASGRNGAVPMLNEGSSRVQDRTVHDRGSDKILKYPKEAPNAAPKAAAPAPKPAAAKPAGGKFCGSCGAARAGAAKFCSQCGNKF